MPRNSKYGSRRISVYNITNTHLWGQLSTCIYCLPTCGWLFPLCHTVLSTVCPEWYCVRSSKGYSMCMPRCAWRRGRHSRRRKQEGWRTGKKMEQKVREERRKEQKKEEETMRSWSWITEQWQERHQPSCQTHFSNSSVMVPLGSASTLLPQNLSLG